MKAIRAAVFLLMCLVFAEGCPAAPAPGVTLQTGTYPLEWRVPKMAVDFDPRYPFNSSGENAYTLDLKPVSASSGRTYRGLKSASALVGDGGGFVVLVDESKGSGGGYDTAYMAANKAEIAVIL